MITLRDMIESDIDDYVRWFTVDNEWMDFDAPWEDKGSSKEEELKSWSEYYQSIKDLPKEETRWKLEIVYNNQHIGWVSYYFDLEYLDNPERIPAIGIDIPEKSVYNKGLGTEALKQFIAYLKDKGYKNFFIQTWSGNKRMLRVAEKLGFEVFFIKKNHRLVNDTFYDAITLIKRT